MNRTQNPWAPAPKPPAPAPMLLDVHAVAVLLGLGLTKTRALTTSGELPSVKIGNRRLYRVRDVEAFVASLPSEGGAGE